MNGWVNYFLKETRTERNSYAKEHCFSMELNNSSKAGCFWKVETAQVHYCSYAMAETVPVQNSYVMAETVQVQNSCVKAETVQVRYCSSAMAETAQVRYCSYVMPATVQVRYYTYWMGGSVKERCIHVKAETALAHYNPVMAESVRAQELNTAMQNRVDGLRCLSVKAATAQERSYDLGLYSDGSVWVYSAKDGRNHYSVE